MAGGLRWSGPTTGVVALPGIVVEGHGGPLEEGLLALGCELEVSQIRVCSDLVAGGYDLGSLPWMFDRCADCQVKLPEGVFPPGRCPFPGAYAEEFAT